MVNAAGKQLDFNTDSKRAERKNRTAVTGYLTTDDTSPNRYIMRQARKRRKPKIMYAPVKVMSPEEYARSKK